LKKSLWGKTKENGKTKSKGDKKDKTLLKEISCYGLGMSGWANKEI